MNDSTTGNSSAAGPSTESGVSEKLIQSIDFTDMSTASPREIGKWAADVYLRLQLTEAHHRSSPLSDKQEIHNTVEPFLHPVWAIRVLSSPRSEVQLTKNSKSKSKSTESWVRNRGATSRSGTNGPSKSSVAIEGGAAVMKEFGPDFVGAESVQSAIQTLSEYVRPFLKSETSKNLIDKAKKKLQSYHPYNATLESINNTNLDKPYKDRHFLEQFKTVQGELTKANARLIGNRTCSGIVERYRPPSSGKSW